MATSGDHDDITITAGADLSAMQYKVIGVAGTIAATVGPAIGVLLNKPKSGEFARVAYSGHMKAIAGAAITAGDPIVVTTSGFIITNATSTSGIVGKCLTTCTSGSLCEFLGDFSVARTSYSIGIV